MQYFTVQNTVFYRAHYLQPFNKQAEISLGDYASFLMTASPRLHWSKVLTLILFFHDLASWLHCLLQYRHTKDLCPLLPFNYWILEGFCIHTFSISSDRPTKRQHSSTHKGSFLLQRAPLNPSDPLRLFQHLQISLHPFIHSDAPNAKRR